MGRLRARVWCGAPPGSFELVGRGRPLPRDIESFIAAHIHSLEQVEILLLLRADAGRPSSVDAISRRLQRSPASVAARLQTLAAQGLLKCDEGLFRYDPAPETEELVKRFADLFDSRRTSVIERIFRPERSPMQSLADAFRLRDEDGDG